MASLLQPVDFLISFDKNTGLNEIYTKQKLPQDVV